MLLGAVPLLFSDVERKNREHAGDAHSMSAATLGKIKASYADGGRTLELAMTPVYCGSVASVHGFSPAMSVSRVCITFHGTAHAIFVVPPAHDRLVPRSSLRGFHSALRSSLRFCAVASSNGALPTPSCLSEHYPLLLSGVERRTKSMQTTHTVREQSH